MPLNYEEVDQNPIEAVRKLFLFAGLEFGKQTEEFILDSRKKTGSGPYSIYRNPSTRWDNKKELPETIVNAIKRDLSYFPPARDWYFTAGLESQ